MNENAGAAQANLARVVVLLDGYFGGKVEVGILEDQQRTLATEFERKWGQVVGGRFGNDFGGRHRTGKRNASDVGVGDEGSAGFAAVTLNNIEYAIGNARLLG